jgi:hypothetical protein
VLPLTFDHALLLEKLKLYGFDEIVLNWTRSYLTNRGVGYPKVSYWDHYSTYFSQMIFPTWSTITLHIYLIPQTFCDTCGGTVCYVDDATYSVGHSDPAVLSNTLTEQYNKMADYMSANKLVINDDKTHLVVMATKKFNQKRLDVRIQAGPFTIAPSPTEKLLGCVISQDLKWKQHILGSDQSMIKQLASRINGLSMMSYRTSFSMRLMVAN